MKVRQMIFVNFVYLTTLQKNIETLGTRHFDLSAPYSKQTEQSRSIVLEEVFNFSPTFSEFQMMYSLGDEITSGVTGLREQLGFQGLCHLIPDIS
jgi:hypothetical protein